MELIQQRLLDRCASEVRCWPFRCKAAQKLSPFDRSNSAIGPGRGKVRTFVQDRAILTAKTAQKPSPFGRSTPPISLDQAKVRRFVQDRAILTAKTVQNPSPFGRRTPPISLNQGKVRRFVQKASSSPQKLHKIPHLSGSWKTNYLSQWNLSSSHFWIAAPVRARC